MFVMMYMYKKFPSDMTDKQIESAILKHNRNVERRVEDIRASVALELSCELWVGGNVKWI